MPLNLEILGNPLSAWLTALAIALAINLAVGVIKWAIITRLSAIARKTSTALDDSLIEVMRRTRQWLVFFVTLYIGSQYLVMADQVDQALKATATAAAFVQLGLWGGAMFEFWLGRYRQRSMQADAGAATSLSALNFTGKILLWSVVVLLTLDNLGVDVTALVAGLGVGGVAVALAVQNILGDLFASLSIVIDKPFVLGDFIVVDDYMGTVEHVGLKTTRVRSLGGEQLIFSNSDLLKARLRNYKRMRERRVLFSFGVTYQTPAEQVERIPGMVKQIIEAQKLARYDRAHFKEFGDSSLSFEVVYWMLDPDYNTYMDTQQSINLALMRALAKENIGFAYPTRSVFIEGPRKIDVP